MRFIITMKEENTDKIIVVGHIVSYVFKSSDSLYKVVKIETTDNKSIIGVGSFIELDEGLDYEFVGQMTNHQKYGSQFLIESYSRTNNYTKDGLIEYLSSEKFYGIGPKLAENIYNELGPECIKIILEDPSKLDNVKGLTKAKTKILVETLKNNYAIEQVYIKLYSFGLTSKMIKKLYDTYGNSAVNKIEEDPYRLIYEVEGFGFKKSDNLALNLGIKKNDDRRIKAALSYTLYYICNHQGFTYLTTEQLINSVQRLLNDAEVSSEKLKEIAYALAKENKIIIEDDRCFEPYLFYAEVQCAKKILNISKTKAKYTKEEIERALDYVQTNIEIKYTPIQRDAIVSSLANNLSIITGGPGTGKSTILKGILLTYAKLNKLTLTSEELAYKVLLVAPTGRAAKRMSETTNFKASTIHKALGYNYDGDFSYNEDNHLTASLLIVDETSMLDIVIASNLFKALNNTCQVILVGDVNQLPSVGPGNVLSDLINSSFFNVTRLNQILRQASGSDIVSLSHMVLNEKIDYSIFSRKTEVFFYDYEAKDLINGIEKILDNFILKGGNLFSEIQILAPMYAGVAGIDAINELVQRKYNPEEEKIIKRENKFFKKNDKVLQLKNDSELELMNGDIGKILDIVKIDDKDVLLIDFDGRIVKYYASDIDNLSLAYAISIHKSQGGEFDNVILPVLPSYSIMLRKKIIYTAITRAKKKLIVLGKLKSLDYSLKQQEIPRQTLLFQRLSIKENDNRIEDPNIPFDTLGEYDMDGITPYSFM